MKVVWLLAFLAPLFCVAQWRGLEISGRVDDEAGKPLTEAIVLIAGTTIGVVTDNEGYYKLAIPDSLSGKIITLQFLYLGCTTLDKK